VVAVYFWIAVGSALGGMARFWFSDIAARHWGEAFPWGTILVNISGSFLIGFFASLTGPEGRYPVGYTGRTFFMTGICGGYTTFSAFSLQTLGLMRGGDWAGAGANIGVSVVACILAVWLGHLAAMGVNQLKGA
jgi:fluoride exporter